MRRKQPKRTAGKMVTCAMAGFFICAVIGGVSFGVASADAPDELAAANVFGFDSAVPVNAEPVDDQVVAGPKAGPEQPAIYERAAFASTSSRDITAGLKMIDDRERAEQERIAAENAAAIERMKAQKAMQGVVSEPTPEPPANEGEPASEEPQVEEEVVYEDPVMEYNLPAVDWTVGREAFVAEWSGRIDAYLAGSPLSGYGAVFAEAAWDSGVDPRWSPAISCTESSKGSVCFASHNAWGWGSSAWDDWDTAIRSHVAGLASGYGYSITLDAAQTYCPPNYVHWYNNTLEEMSYI